MFRRCDLLFQEEEEEEDSEEEEESDEEFDEEQYLSLIKQSRSVTREKLQNLLRHAAFRVQKRRAGASFLD